MAASLLDKPEAEWLPLVREAAIDAMMDMIRDDLAALDIHHDVFFSERSLQRGQRRPGRARRSTELRARDLVYMGRLPPPKGQKDEDWEDREQLLFRATAFGDEVDRPLLKSDGSYTYFASDIAYHRSKFERGFAADDRRLGRRPWRLREAHAGGREGRDRTARAISTSSSASS